MTRKAERDIPIGPLLRRLRGLENNDLKGPARARYEQAATTRTMAEHLGIHHDTLRRYKKIGMDVFTADELAARCDWHPLEVWSPEEYFGARGDRVDDR